MKYLTFIYISMYQLMFYSFVLTKRLWLFWREGQQISEKTSTVWSITYPSPHRPRKHRNKWPPNTKRWQPDQSKIVAIVFFASVEVSSFNFSSELLSKQPRQRHEDWRWPRMGEDGRRWADALAQVRFHPECRARDTKIAHQHFESSSERVERLWLVDVMDTTNLLQHQQGETLQHESKWKSWLGTDHRQSI